MADHRLDGGSSPERAFDLRRDPALLTCSEDPELAIGRRVMTAVTGIGNGAFESVADECLYGWDDGRKRVATHHAGNEASAPSSFPVTTPTTRGSRFAATELMPMRACGWGERKAAACRSPATGSRSSM
jgi:hypothetical protein